MSKGIQLPLQGELDDYNELDRANKAFFCFFDDDLSFFQIMMHDDILGDGLEQQIRISRQNKVLNIIAEHLEDVNVQRFSVNGEDNFKEK